MSQNATILSQIAQMEVALAQMRALLTDSTDAPVTPVKGAKAVSRVPDAPLKAGAEPLNEADLVAMVKAGVKAGAQVKTLGKTLFAPLGIPEHLWKAAREQWKAHRETVSDEDAKTLAAEPVLTEEICEALKSHGGYDAKSRTKKLAAEFTDYEIHLALHDKAGKEWREWAEAHGLGQRSKAPTRTPAVKKEKVELPALLNADMLAQIRDGADPDGKPFHGGSQKRKLADTLTGLGIAEKDHARAAKEWREYAKAEGIARGGSKTSSAKGSTQGSEGVPESVGPAAASPEPASPKAAASSSAKILTPTHLSRMSDAFSSNAAPNTTEVRKILALIGIPRSSFLKAEMEWREWAKENHTTRMDTEIDDELDLGLDGEE